MIASNIRAGVLLLATVTTGLTAGLFAAFAYAVMPGLARVDDRAFVAGLRAINQAILNGWFALCFGGALVCTLAAVLLHLPAGLRGPLPWLIAGLVLYVLVLAVTAAVNVPLNDRLEAGAARLADPAELRATFESAWVRWNVVRAVLNTAAFGCLGVALLVARSVPA
ncbi:anthrone oxygenase family protein [Micromonospora sp. NPDC005707]|uniref:anthrone oxygenase family protein n=1 Tax=Micromonospora sp. NPDC005707 TaxID=3157050 RepID=UPI0033F85647